MAYAPGDPKTPSHLRTAANGWNGSRYIGGAAAAPPATTPPQPMGSVTPPPTTSGGAQPPGPPQPFQREQFRDSWMGTGTDVNAQNALLKQHNLTPDQAGRVKLPTGETLDLRFGAKAGINRASWTGVSGGGAKTGQAGPGAPPGAPGSGGPGAPVGGPAGVSDDLTGLLLQRAKQGTQINAQDPNIRQQVEPFQASQERARRNYLADLAESAGPNANLRGESRLASERAGQASGMLESQLIGTEIAARRDEIRHALDSLGARLSEDQRLALTRELAYLEDATQRYGISNQTSIARDQIGLGRDRLGLDYSELDWRMDPRNPYNLPR